MTQANDKFLSQLTVRLKRIGTNTTIGTGIIYYENRLKDKIYILTAAHCLFEDGDNFKNIFQAIEIDIYSYSTNSYQTLYYDKIDETLLLKDADKDVAVLILDKHLVEAIVNTIPTVNVVKEKYSHDSFVVKGFPNATQGKELAVLSPTWIQTMTEVFKFQLQLNEDYNSWAIKGFSGAGVFLEANNEVYLLGLFTRYRPEDNGRVIYCQYIETINEFLEKKYLPAVIFSYLGEYGLTPTFFQKNIQKSILNLGPRFTEELNVKLPIARLFSDIAKDTSFRNRFFKIIDNWLVEQQYRKLLDNEYLNEIEKQLDCLKQKVLLWISSTVISINSKIEINWIVEETNQLNNKINSQKNILYDLQAIERDKNKDKKKDYNYTLPYDKEIYRLREIEKNNDTLLYGIQDDINVNLSNNPFLIIQGQAGCGKSHLLGDVATERIKNKIPTLLLLGQHFKSGKSIEQNIIEQLHVNCTFQQLLFTLNSIGCQIDNRVLILIDAINEGDCAELWKNEIAGFINEISNFPFVGLVLTIRDTYRDFIIPDNVIHNPDIEFVTHKGFEGNEYAALKLFCEYHGLKQPNFPILAPEFTNPLFLQLICKGVELSEDKTFPKGFQGIKNIFQVYTQSLKRKFLEKREEYKYSDVVIDAIHKISFACFKNETRSLTLREVNILLEKEFPNYRYLLIDLIEENVLIKNILDRYETQQKEEVVYFSYQRFGDFFIAENLLDKFQTSEEVKIAFQKNTELGKFIENHYWVYRGILEALSVLLPEKFNLEIFEVYEWLFIEEDKEEYCGNTGEWLNHFLLDSLKWRTVESINDEKLSTWLRGKYFRINYDQYLIKLVELTIIENHPLNSDRLHKIFTKLSMAKRDNLWQLHLHYYNRNDDAKNALPIRRLIDWAWTPNISSKLDFETARLTAQTLAWILSTTNRKLRDETTKALVNLLEQQPNALIAILKAFKNIDDLYILERLYAVAYGCVLRTELLDSIKIIAQVTYNLIFKKGNPPHHILLRDYARNIIEFAIYKKATLKINVGLIRPPYKSPVPILPNVNEVIKYKLNHDSPDFENNYGRQYNRIYFSVMDGDFGEKTINSTLHKFSPIPFTQEKELKIFLKKLSSKARAFLKVLFLDIEIKVLLGCNESKMKRVLGEAKYNEWSKENNQLLEQKHPIMDSLFSQSQMNYIKEEIIPYLEIKNKLKAKDNISFDAMPIKRWIVQKVFELGYKKEWHGNYDSNVERYNDRHNNRVERIGKKYQWIAYYEILGIITDNYMLKEGWGSNAKFKFYRGAWQLYLRNIDPAFITKNRTNSEDDEDGLDIVSDTNNWWSDIEYNNWNLPNQEWVEEIKDLPNPKDVILKKDDNGVEWLYLEQFAKWEEPKPIGKDRYSVVRKEIWYLIQGYLVNTNNKQRVINHLNNKNFWGRWMPENRDNFSHLFNREKFWSPIYFDEDRERKWESIEGLKCKIIVATTEAKGSLGEDKSGANFSYSIPCKTIFEGMNLQYAPIDGDFENDTGELIVTNINPKGGVLIKKKELLKYLEENNLAIFWTVLGEKNASQFMSSVNYFKVPCGVFYFDKENLEGEMKLFDRD